MADILSQIKQRAKSKNTNIVLPEGEDGRVVAAAAAVVKEGFARITLLGNGEEIAAKNAGVDLSGVNVIDPKINPKTDDYAALLFKIREGKINKKTGLPEYADVAAAKAAILKDYTMYGALMLKAGDVDGMVSGACHSTANTLQIGRAHV